MAQQPLSQLLAPGAKARNLDLQALLAIAGHEGASGGIGDGGHAFGPFQLNNAGGVLTGKFPGQSPQQINQWAWSPAGINYALDGIGRVAAGQRGRQAVESIASRFERPANIPGEIADAMAHYGGPTGLVPQIGGASGSASPMFPGGPPGVPSAPPAAPRGNPQLAALLGSTNQMLGLPGSPLLAQLIARGGR